jgi:hypothetical protein
MVLGCSEIRTVLRFISAILADLAMRGFAISFTTLARVAFAASLLALFITASFDSPARSESDQSFVSR